MTFDINNGFRGNLFGRDRLGHTTPDAEASESLRPWLPVPYPAPYLPAKRQDQGHPILANVVFSSQNLAGQDVNGAFVPAGLFCGDSGSGGYCALKYSSYDVGFAYNAITGLTVQAAGEVAVLASPTAGTSGDVITFADGTTYTVSAGDVTTAKACTLFPMGVVKPIGIILRNVFQYIGGVNVTSTTGGIRFTLNGLVPTKFKVMNYMHEMGTAVQTEYVLRLPWIGAAPNTLQTLATTDGVIGYTQSAYGRSFVHFTGTIGDTNIGEVGTGGDGNLCYGNLVVGSQQLDDSGNFAPYNSSVHKITDICGRIIGIQNMYPIRDYANRVRTLWDPNRLVGPIKDPNPASIMMGGSATGGIDYQLNLGTDGLFKKAYDQGKTLRPEYSSYVLVKVNL